MVGRPARRRRPDSGGQLVVWPQQNPRRGHAVETRLFLRRLCRLSLRLLRPGPAPETMATYRYRGRLAPKRKGAPYWGAFDSWDRGLLMSNLSWPACADKACTSHADQQGLATFGMAAA